MHCQQKVAVAAHYFTRDARTCAALVVFSIKPTSIFVLFVQQWFVHLPPILTFELSRFQFNKNLARPEKIHNHFDFPVEIFMDRWLLWYHAMLECHLSLLIVYFTCLIINVFVGRAGPGLEIYLVSPAVPKHLGPCRQQLVTNLYATVQILVECNSTLWQ